MKQRLLGALGALCRRQLRELAVAPRVDGVVVHALRDEDQVGEAKVDGEGYDGGDETSPHGADEVGDVANEPDDEKGEGDAFGGALAVVFNQLGDLLFWFISSSFCALANIAIAAIVVCGISNFMHYPKAVIQSRRRTRRKIHAANETLPKTPLSAS